MRDGTGFAGRVAGAFIDSKLTQLLILGSLLVGLFAVVAAPREEKPQIVVPSHCAESRPSWTSR